MKPDAWKFQVISTDSPMYQVVLHEGECETYEACRMAIFLFGIEVRTRPGAVTGWKGFFSGDRQCFVRFQRLSDGYVMTEWGTNEEKQFPPG